MDVQQDRPRQLLAREAPLEFSKMTKRLGLPENLERVLSSTNLIENLFGRVRSAGG